ncbi:RnfABCDGE type electron transport complex subunit D [Vogesella sp. LIG4]|uniref:RnfABCDGE type electron transport complex subunit D n=1 Tax=Vogesella sp. LIG4 TaxID=1192162 RepID=UPI0008201C28|nr:RnfABCDGE type electron transport complex subunit D [Vogesella sp. LIG4]SCK30468.1 electron transport complex protein RnfD [Vogesella sp. LIG4]
MSQYAPHIARATTVATLMRKVLVALLPGIALSVWFNGPALLWQLPLASITALLAEAAMLRMRGLAPAPFLKDLSAVVSAWLLVLFMSPLAPWWLIVVATLFAIVVAKQLYGGLGNNLFNPAMAGLAVAVLAFPAHMAGMDALPATASAAGWIALGWLLGGLWLWQQKVINWQAPLAMLAAVGAMSELLWQLAPSHSASPLWQLSHGGLLLAAGFILTDPVTSPWLPRGRLLFGLAVGLLTVLLRVNGEIQGAIAFAVLIMNCVVPFIDRHTWPKAFGYRGKRRG